MRTLSIIIDEDGHVKSNAFAGYAGEHNFTRISAGFSGIAPGATYYRMTFQDGCGKSVVTAQLKSVSGRINYDLPTSVTALGSPVFWQMTGYMVQSGSVTMVCKTEAVALLLKNSLTPAADEVNTSAGDLENLINQVESFASGFSLSANAKKLSTATTSGVTVTRNGWNYTLNFTFPEAVGQNVTSHSNYAANTLFGNRFSPSSQADNALYFVKTGRLVSVCGSVIFNKTGDRGHTTALASNDVIYLPFAPATYGDATLYDDTADPDTRSNVTAYISPANNALSLRTGSLQDGHLYRMTFSYVSES